MKSAIPNFQPKPGLPRVEHPVSAIETGSFLTVVGGIDSDSRLVVEPGFVVNYRRSSAYPELSQDALQDAIIVEFLDERREVLTQCPIPLASVCTTRATDPGFRMFTGSLIIPAKYDFIRYHFRDRLLKEQQRPDKPPTVKFSQTPDAKARDYETVGWEVIKRADTEIRSIVLFSNNDGKTWEPVVPPSSSPSNSVSVRFANLPGGTARLKVLATDGFSTAEAVSAPFEVAIKGVRPSILGPSEGTEVSSQSRTWFYGQAYDYERQDAASAELVWRSSRDGELGRGRVISAQLSSGMHEITLTCCGHIVNLDIVAKPNPKVDSKDSRLGKEPQARSGNCGCTDELVSLGKLREP